MSDDITVKFTSLPALLAALVVFTGGGGVFAALRRRSQQARPADPEAIELVVAGEGGDSVAVDIGEDSVKIGRAHV